MVTTCGAPWLYSKWIGEPGKRIILNGIGALCHPNCKKLYLAQYNMDKIDQRTRESFLAKVGTKTGQFI